MNVQKRREVNMMKDVLLQTDMPDIRFLRKGKVRDIYEVVV